MKVYYKDLAIDCFDSNVAIHVFKELFKFIYGNESKSETNIPDVNISLTDSKQLEADFPADYIDPTKESLL